VSLCASTRGTLTITAARAKNGTVDAGMYQFQSMEVDTRYALKAAALPAKMARLRRLLTVEKAL